MNDIVLSEIKNINFVEEIPSLAESYHNVSTVNNNSLPETFKYLEKISANIKRSTDLLPPQHFIISDLPVIKIAYIASLDYVVITLGAMQSFSESELTSILSHEMGHKKRHDDKKYNDGDKVEEYWADRYAKNVAGALVAIVQSKGLNESIGRDGQTHPAIDTRILAGVYHQLEGDMFGDNGVIDQYGNFQPFTLSDMVDNRLIDKDKAQDIVEYMAYKILSEKESLDNTSFNEKDEESLYKYLYTVPVTKDFQLVADWEVILSQIKEGASQLLNEVYDHLVLGGGR